MTILRIINAISFSITAHIIVTLVQLLQKLQSLKSNKTAHKILIAAQKFKKIFKKNMNLFTFVKKFLMKTILVSFDFMQNFDFILISKIYQNRLLNT